MISVATGWSVMGTDNDHSQDATEPTIIDALGIELSVSNEAVADALRASADSQPLIEPPVHDAEDIRRMRADAAEAVPDVIIAVQTPRDTEEARVRAELRIRVDILGRALGFEVQPDGVWRTGNGQSVTVRIVSYVSSAAAAADMLAKIATTLEGGGDDGQALIVTGEQADADALSAAIRPRESGRFRIASLATLQEISTLCAEGRLDGLAAQGLLIPSIHSDVARMLALLKPLLARD